MKERCVYSQVCGTKKCSRVESHECTQPSHSPHGFDCARRENVFCVPCGEFKEEPNPLATPDEYHWVNTDLLTDPNTMRYLEERGLLRRVPEHPDTLIVPENTYQTAMDIINRRRID